MDSRKNGNLAKLVAFFLIVTVLVMAIAFSASGWQGEDQQEPDSGKTPTGGTADENTDGDTNITPEPIAPTYTHYISGLEISEEESLLKPLCIIYDTEAPMYGISSSFLSVEIPTEGGKTRLLAFTNEATSHGKVGALAPTRRYISNIASYFSAVPVFMGNDDSFAYDGIDADSGYIDLAGNHGYHYTEYNMYNYSNADLLNAYIRNNGTGVILSDTPSAPYTFRKSGAVTVGDIQASTALIQFDKGSTTELIYSRESDSYRIQKNANALIDKLDDSTPSYDNAIILFADAVTHETSTATELILDTMGGGDGYYLNGGMAQRITWATTDAGDLAFYSETGDILAIEPGSSYIAFAKSSLAGSTRLA